MQLVQFPLSHRVTTVVFLASPWDSQPTACSLVISVARLSSWLTHTLSSLHVEPCHYPPFLSFIMRSSLNLFDTHTLVTLQKFPCPRKMFSNSFFKVEWLNGMQHWVKIEYALSDKRTSWRQTLKYFLFQIGCSGQDGGPTSHHRDHHGHQTTQGEQQGWKSNQPKV